jgi:hypothetical protein
MARTVPSQIVALIDQNPPGGSATFAVSHATVGVLTAVTRLVSAPSGFLAASLGWTLFFASQFFPHYPAYGFSSDSENLAI